MTGPRRLVESSPAPRLRNDGDFIDFMRRIVLSSYEPIFLLYTVVLILLPAGDVRGINVKVLLFSLICLPAIFQRFSRCDVSIPDVIIMFAVPGGLFFWVVYGMLLGAAAGLALQQYKDIAVTLAGAWFIALYCAKGPLQAVRFIRTVIFTITATSALKVALFAYAASVGVPVTRYVQAISDFFDVQLMTVDFGDELFGRFELISDSVIPLCLFALFSRHERLRIGSLSALLISIIMIISLVAGFSRYLWVFGLLALIFSFVCARRGKLHATFTFLFGIGITASLPLLISIFELRFSTRLAGASDLERRLQNVALSDFFRSAPILGHGLGSYTSFVIRSVKAPYSYENQLLALLAQTGIVGVSLLAMLTIYYYRKIFISETSSTIYRGSLLLMLGLWLSGGFFNPQLLSSSASIFFGFLFALTLI